MTKTEKQQRDDEFAEIVDSWGEYWVEASTVASHYNARHQLGRDGLSAVGVGRVLSRLADEGRCEREVGFVSRYRARQA